MIDMHNRIKIAKEYASTIQSEDIELIILFGSVARGDDTEESDIDILIVSPKADDIKEHIVNTAVDMLFRTNEVITPHIMTLEHFNKTKNYPFLSNILKEGIIIGRLGKKYFMK